ncbi:putative baseplate assembly protein [Jatrophihabitans telluris]|uniref:Baseplate assembly protein n=1 Tax=Jatrophihabitans telluris TaxID=2038343 RepID=A0ABY4QY12_9ACTN|nr:putative baseplate assembly protein [Jatrophihabitans telluris]UQX88117.1 putative baseplate assembly protein [Jatrophihabitans telluris]
MTGSLATSGIGGGAGRPGRGAHRAAEARRAGLNGIDGIGVSADGLRLTVLLFGPVPTNLTTGEVTVSGGRRITDLRVTGIDVQPDDPDRGGRFTVQLDRSGDRSPYTLAIGQRGSTYPGFDPPFASIEFSFANCPSFTDCDSCGCGGGGGGDSTDGCARDSCGDSRGDRADPGPAIEIDYLAKDYASFRQLLLERLSLTMPTWTERHVPDVGIALVELFAYVGDRLSYQQDAAATEAYLDTARLRTSVRRHARLVDYRMHDGCNARAWVCVEVSEQITLPAGDFRFAAIPLAAGAGSSSAAVQDQDLDGLGPSVPVFEPLTTAELTLYPAHTGIALWAWGEPEWCLPAGSCSAALVDTAEHGLQLAAGDVLVLREQRDPVTGNPADADRTHCQAVRLTRVDRRTDELYQQPLVQVHWADDDALGFDLCVTARGGPECEQLQVGIADANTVLVDHGRTSTWNHRPSLPVGRPPSRTGTPGCPPQGCWGCPLDCGAAGNPVPGPPYPPERARLRYRLPSAGTTQAAAFPVEAVVARGQAALLRSIPLRARANVVAILERISGGEGLTDDDRAYLQTLFGAQALRRAGLADNPVEALTDLSGRLAELLDPKRQRLAQLADYARAGYLLKAEDEVWEIAQAWGADAAADLLPSNPALFGPASAALLTDPRQALPAVTLTDPDGSADWQPRHDLLESGPRDRDFVGETDDEDRLSLRFGDGANGAAFPDGRVLQLGFRLGNGAAGNIAAGSINHIVLSATRTDAIRAVSNPLAAQGGTDPESKESVLARAPLQARRRLVRAVTAADYAALAAPETDSSPRTTAEIEAVVQRAAAELRWTGSHYLARVGVDQLGQERASSELLHDVAARLNRYRKIGHEVTVQTARLVPVDLAVRVSVRPDYLTGSVRRAVADALGARTLPGGRTGLFHPDNLTFGSPVRLSRIVACVAAVPGVAHVEVTRLQRLFGPPGTALADGVLVMSPLEVPQLDGDQDEPENGRLVLDLVGGR